MMNEISVTEARRRKRPPAWLQAVLGVFVALFALGSYLGAPTRDPQPSAVAAPPPTPVPPADVFTVSKVIDAETIVLAYPEGADRTVRPFGIDAPTGTDCFATEATDWATRTLTGQRVTVDFVGELASLSTGGGDDYSIAAVRAGFAKAAFGEVETPAAAVLAVAEDSARSDVTGLWAPPCAGSTATPAPQQAAREQAAPTTSPRQQTPRARTTTRAPQPEVTSPDPGSVTPPPAPTTQPSPNPTSSDVPPTTSSDAGTTSSSDDTGESENSETGNATNSEPED